MEEEVEREVKAEAEAEEDGVERPRLKGTIDLLLDSHRTSAGDPPRTARHPIALAN
jgi:hypothetical protein